MATTLWTLYFVVMAPDGVQRAIYQVTADKPGVTLLSRILTVHGKGVDPLFSNKSINWVDIVGDHVTFHASIEDVACPLVAAFDLYEQAVACCRVANLSLLDSRWLMSDTRRLSKFLREYFLCRNPAISVTQR